MAWANRYEFTNTKDITIIYEAKYEYISIVSVEFMDFRRFRPNTHRIFYRNEFMIKYFLCSQILISTLAYKIYFGAW